jgi:hypothetical protein
LPGPMEASVNCRMVTNVLAEDVESNFALNIQSSTAQLLWSDVWPGSQHGWPPKTPTRPPVGGTSWSQMRWICLGSQNHSQYDCRSSRTASQTVSKNACIEVCSSSPCATESVPTHRIICIGEYHNRCESLRAGQWKIGR